MPETRLPHGSRLQEQRNETAADLYSIRESDAVTTPASLGAALRRLGPGLIISGSIVGSGELIATTTLGAKIGYVALWLIVVSCLIKVIIQAELGRYTISSGESTLRAPARIPVVLWRCEGEGYVREGQSRANRDSIPARELR